MPRRTKDKGKRQAAIRKAIKKHDGNKTAAAEELGIPRSEVYRLLPKRKRKGGDASSLVLADVHIPYEDPGVVEAALEFGRRKGPTHVHLLGDIADCYQLSRFSKDPSRVDDLWNDVCLCRAFLGSVREAFPNADIRFSEGNHENRLQRYLWSEAPALNNLPALRIDKLLALDEYEIDYHPQREPYAVGDLLFLHGNLVRKHSGWTAKAHFEKYRRSCIVGHAHRMGSYFVRHGEDLVGCWECPCLCDLDPEYDLLPDWHQGWSWITHSADGRFEVETVPVIGGRYSFRGKTFKV